MNILRKYVAPVLFGAAMASASASCMLTDLFQLQPVGGIPVFTVARQAAGAAAEGWFLGCNAALATQNTKFSAAGNQDCGGVHNGAEFIGLYVTAARNAGNDMVPIARANQHFYYRESGLEACKSAVLMRSYLLTRLYLESTIETGSRANVLGPDDFAASTLFGVRGTGQACFDAIEPTGRIVSFGELAL